MKQFLLTAFILIGIGFTNYSNAQEKVSAMFKIFDAATWSYNYYSGVVEYEIKKSIFDGKPYYNLTHYTIYGWRGEFASEYFPSGGSALMEHEETVNGVTYGYSTTHPFLNGTIYVK
jgi:hypothetical protein